MLQELSVKNFAIISSLQLEFQMGMTVLTGETGGNPSLLMQWDYSQADAAPVTIFVKEQINAP